MATKDVLQKQKEFDVESVLLNENVYECNIVEALINIFTTPIAKRKGVFISANDCKEYAKDLQEYLNKE